MLFFMLVDGYSCLERFFVVIERYFISVKCHVFATVVLKGKLSDNSMISFKAFIGFV